MYLVPAPRFQELDLKVGVAFSRFQTRFFQGQFADLDSSVISYGPCQTPTLGFCVDRHDQITVAWLFLCLRGVCVAPSRHTLWCVQSFVPEAFWSLNVQVRKAGKSAALAWQRGRLFDHVRSDPHPPLTACSASRLCSAGVFVCVSASLRLCVSCVLLQAVALVFEDAVRSAGRVHVTQVTRKEARKARPLPLNTVEMLRVASRALGMSPSSTMHVAEQLYLRGFISYPRTESTAYPASFDLKDAVSKFTAHPEWSAHVHQLLRDGLNRPRPGHDAGDHPPITPVRCASAWGLR